ncbi:MAG: precorrin-8X methylmutase [Thaumarchaeota archaeon]|uniref:Precorrin-8X methylmutase (CobH, cbiC) n=1 Tax=uncultured marine thaumarchaeote SAT1000_48_A08 TaxID=1456414 RepID=A0A075IBM8_9ARCH|nr:precorrin-8X methylmutase (cobH, cbiC) [uncultured marine thaumarchaeote SAT1000_48_A08]MAY24646.1 precorrin-8X methylmutase [Nitrososphaerota archaeon]|tara:strand:+ start:555 stop:1184 length:630 start_codon:yes stop_codon:yes gene_type:complete
MQTRKGQSIEDESMQIIENEIGSHSYNEQEWPIVRRIIHSTADFDFARDNKIIFHKNAVQNGLDALKNGCSIIVDVNGIIGLMNKQNPKDFKNNVICNISEPSLIEMAKKEDKTRAQMSMRVAKEDMNGGIVVIGNAPTALLEVMKMIREDITKPALVIGIPVGFVSAVESKEELAKMNIPFITNQGRKGGSPCASAIVNALYKLLRQG